MSTILGSQDTIKGNTQNSLADRWMAQTLSTSAEVNPFITDDVHEPRGRRGSVELNESFQQKSPNGVSFLGGTFLGPNPVVRTIVGQSDTVYFTPFENFFADNTTTDFSPNSGFPGGYALTPQNLADLTARGLTPRDLTAFLGSATILEYLQANTNVQGQFVEIDGNDKTPGNIGDYRQETGNLSYGKLPRSTGALYSTFFYPPGSTIFVADPDLGTNLNDTDPFNDIFPQLKDINPSGKKAVVPFVQTGDYFGFTLDQGSNTAGAHTIHFGTTSVQDITYNILNPIKGGNGKDNLIGTQANDYIDGRNGKDNLSGQGGDDLMLGGNGADCIDGGTGSDELWGDAGNDTFIFRRGYGHDTVFDLQKGDKVDIHGLTVGSQLSETLLNGLAATQIAFANGDGGDLLTLVGVQPGSLTISNGVITV